MVAREDGHHRQQKKLFFNLRKGKGRISALDEGDLKPDQVAQIATKLGVPEQEVIDMNRRLSGDTSLNAPLREEARASGRTGSWTTARARRPCSPREEEGQNRLSALRDALSVLNPRERRIFEASRLADDPIHLEDLSGEFGVSRERVRQIECGPSRRSRRRSSATSPPAKHRAPRRVRAHAERSSPDRPNQIEKGPRRHAPGAFLMAREVRRARSSAPLIEGVLEHTVRRRPPSRRR